MSHYATPRHMFTGVPAHLITMKQEHIEHPHFQTKAVRAYYQDNSDLSNQQGYAAVSALGLVIHTPVMLGPTTECTAYHPKLGNCPFCFSIDQLYAHCKYDMCEVPLQLSLELLCSPKLCATVLYFKCILLELLAGMMFQLLSSNYRLLTHASTHQRLFRGCGRLYVAPILYCLTYMCCPKKFELLLHYIANDAKWVPASIMLPKVARNIPVTIIAHHL